MKHSGRAFQSALKIIFWTLMTIIVISIATVLATIFLGLLVPLCLGLFAVWFVFALFTLYFFRDPNARVPTGTGLILSPAHGKVDIIDQVSEKQFMGGTCQRISTFLSVLDVHVQNAPVSGTVMFCQYNMGQFLSALKSESAEQNENLLLGLETPEGGGAKIGVRLIAGVLARRIVPFVKQGDTVARGERISLIQFGSRTDLYVPLSARVQVKVGDKVKGGETVMATFD
jgi:phosphatidylserine decarboxylase